MSSSPPNSHREPENRPAPLEALLEAETPTALHYRRSHYPYPELDPSTWRLAVDGAVERPLELSLADLRELPSRELTVLLECAGHRRTEYHPPISGVQWELGALGQARWRGVSLAAVLDRAGLRDGAVEVVLHGADSGAFKGVPGEHTFSRSLPLGKALHPDTLLAWEMNGEPLPLPHGAPLRSVVPGWYAMDSVKWLTRAEVVTQPFRGPYQEQDYRFQPAGSDDIGERLAEQPIHSLFVTLRDGDSIPQREITRGVTVRGIAWGGSGGPARVEVRAGEGPWTPAEVTPPPGPYQRALWSAHLALPAAAAGQTVELAVRAWDHAGETQPEQPIWNQRGYRNNSIHRIRVRPGA